uniref:Transmembrane protein 223 n=1 Tax=Lygus hesperus TaxID=30085 RepID=A0A0A9YW34_LYGHE
MSLTNRLCFCGRTLGIPVRPVPNISRLNQVRYYSQNLLDLNTNVAKDVILYKSDKSRFYKYLNLFGITQFGFWMYLGQWSYSSMRDAPVDQTNVTEDTPWWRKINLGENKYRNGITAFCFLTGYIMLAGSWTFTLRSVRFLILRKGGKSVSFVTFTPFGENRIMEVPLKHVSAADSRHSAKVNLPLKVRGKWLHYMLDMRGEFRNTQLFDATVGLRREFKSR